jgi:hypothetical protein
MKVAVIEFVALAAVFLGGAAVCVSAQVTSSVDQTSALPTATDKTSTNPLNIQTTVVVVNDFRIDRGPSVLLPYANGQNPYSSVVRYIGRAQCTGVFIATFPDGKDPRDAPAYVLTNGHCPDFPSSNQVLLDRPAPANHRVVFNYFADAPVAQQVSVPVSRIAYATMKGQDVAVLELAARYDEIIRAGFEPWPITLTLPGRDESVVVVGAPLTGAIGTPFLRLAVCRLESRANRHRSSTDSSTSDREGARPELVCRVSDSRSRSLGLGVQVRSPERDALRGSG